MIQEVLSLQPREFFGVLVPVFQIPAPPWADHPAVLRVLSILNDPAGAAPLTLLVGGCVRNALLGRAVSDFDLATRLLPDAVIARARGAGLKAIPTGISHGTVTVVCEGVPFEVTTLRRDIETDGRHAVVAFTDDWREDAARRDFTLNTLLADGAGRVFDPLGRGLSDLQARRVVFVGDPRARIQEDYLRILRFFRFQADVGAGEPDAAALGACRDLAAGLSHLSRERITQELKKWLSVDNPVDSLRIAFKDNVLTVLFKFSPDFDRLSRLIQLQKTTGCFDILSRLFVFCGGGDGKNLLERTSFSTFDIKILNRISKVKLEKFSMEVENLKRDLYKFGYPTVLSRLFVDLSAGEDGSGAGVWIKELLALRDWRPPTCPLTGHDLLAVGIPAGPGMGDMLKKAEMFWVSHNFSPTRAELLTRFVT